MEQFLLMVKQGLVRLIVLWAGKLKTLKFWWNLIEEVFFLELLITYFQKLNLKWVIARISGCQLASTKYTMRKFSICSVKIRLRINLEIYHNKETEVSVEEDLWTKTKNQFLNPKVLKCGKKRMDHLPFPILKELK